MKITGYRALVMRDDKTMHGDFQLLRVEAGDRKPYEREIQSIASALMFVGEWECGYDYDTAGTEFKVKRVIAVPLSSVVYAEPIIEGEAPIVLKPEPPGVVATLEAMRGCDYHGIHPGPCPRCAASRADDLIDDAKRQRCEDESAFEELAARDREGRMARQ